MLPKLYNFDNYENCFNITSSTRNVYCVVDVKIIPKSSSAVWQKIENLSRPRWKNYQYSHLLYGVCTHRCNETLNLYGKNISKLLTHNSNEENYDENLLKACINYELKKLYRLQALTQTKYCIDGNSTIKKGKPNRLN